MHKKHVQKHDETTKHQNHLKSKQNPYVPISNPSIAGTSYQNRHHNLRFDLDKTYRPPEVADSHQISECIRNVPMDDLEPFAFGDLFGPTFGDRTYTMGEGTHDYFKEAIDILQNGEYQFSFSRPLNLRGEELGLETEEGDFGGEEGFGIDIPGKFYQQVGRTKHLMSDSYRRMFNRQL